MCSYHAKILLVFYLVNHSGSWECWQKPVIPLLQRLSKQNGIHSKNLSPMIMDDGDGDDDDGDDDRA